MAQSLADLIRDLRLRADGIENHLSEMANIGLGQGDVDAGRALANQLETQDAEQEALKAQLKAKTAEMKETRKQARQWRSAATKRIKAQLDDRQEMWVEFGITAKQ